MTSSSSSASPRTSSSPGEATAAREICDLRGEVCPFTFVRTKLALEALPIGATLRVLIDHEPAIRNLPRSATEWGQEVVGVSPVPVGEDGRATWAIDLRKRVR